MLLGSVAKQRHTCNSSTVASLQGSLKKKRGGKNQPTHPWFYMYTEMSLNAKQLVNRVWQYCRQTSFLLWGFTKSHNSFPSFTTFMPLVFSNANCLGFSAEYWALQEAKETGLEKAAGDTRKEKRHPQTKESRCEFLVRSLTHTIRTWTLAQGFLVTELWDVLSKARGCKCFHIPPGYRMWPLLSSTRQRKQSSFHPSAWNQVFYLDDNISHLQD